MIVELTSPIRSISLKACRIFPIAGVGGQPDRICSMFQEFTGPFGKPSVSAGRQSPEKSSGKPSLGNLNFFIKLCDDKPSVGFDLPLALLLSNCTLSVSNRSGSSRPRWLVE
jgi:hypothetical protein